MMPQRQFDRLYNRLLSRAWALPRGQGNALIARWWKLYNRREGNA